MRINTNVSALGTQRLLGQANAGAAKSIGALSSGFRINRAADDASGIGIANRLKADIRALGQASRNAEQGSSMLQVMEGATQTVQGILERMKELGTQAASDNVDSAGRTRIHDEFTALRTELDRVVNTTKFQSNSLLDGSFGSSVTGGTVLASGTNVYDVKLSGTAAGTYTVSNAVAGTVVVTDGAGTQQSIAVGTDGKQDVNFSTFGITLQLDADYTAAGTAVDGTIIVAAGASGASFMVSASGSYAADDLVTLDQVDLNAAVIGTGAGSFLSDASLATATDARSALTIIDDAIADVADALATIGAAQNKIEFASLNVKSSIENFSAAESVVRDVDMAEEMTRFSKFQILQQVGTAMLAQANAAPQSVLRLLQ